MSSSVNDMISRLDANDDGGISKDEWVTNIRSCAALHARIAAAVGDDGTVTTFRDFQEQLDKRTKQVAELEAKEERSAEEEETLTSFKKQIDGLQKRIAERNTNLLKVQEWGKEVFTKFDTDNNGKLSNAELKAAMESLPRKKPKYAPPGTKFMSLGDMVAAMDADG